MGTQIVNIAITRATAAVTRAGFGTPMLLGPTPNVGLVEVYVDALDMLDAGYTSTDALYLEAVACKGQNPSPPLFKVGKLESTVMTSEVVSVLLNAADADVGKSVTVTLDGVEYSYEVIAADTILEIHAGLALAADLAAGVTVTSTATEVLFTADSADTRFTLTAEPVEGNVTVIETTATAGIPESIAAIRELDDDWYGVGSSLRSSADLLSIQATVETLNRICSLTTPDTGVLDAGVTDDVMSLSQALGYERSSLWASAGPLGTAILARMLTTTPGSATWAHQSLAGVPVDSFTPAQRLAIEAKNGNYFRPLGGIGATFNGASPGGEYVDTMRLVDWTEARVQEGVYQVLLANDKVPFTNAGIEMIKAPIKAVMEAGINNGGFAADPAPTVTAPRANDVAVNDRANRVLPDVKFGAQLAGAIHTVIIRGTVSV